MVWVNQLIQLGQNFVSETRKDYRKNFQCNQWAPILWYVSKTDEKQS